MNLFETVKAAVTPRMAAERYGLPIQQGGMVCCPFHADRTPSMKLNEDYFYCFGCGATGDVIDLAARLFDLSKYEAVQKLAADFGISGEKPSVLAKLKRGKTQAEAESHCFRVLRDYFGILQDWKEHCAPQSPEDPIDPRYAEACHMLERIGNMLDILACGTPKERAEVVADLQKDDRLMRMEARNRQIKEDEYGTK
ncbi:MAG: CHC2 zinc finger domain-containing protein [Oscillospiraceae bacterium]